MHLQCRCSKYGETRRSGRIVTSTSTIHTTLQEPSTSVPAALTIRHDDLLRVLTSSKYSKRFVESPGFVIMIFPQTYHPLDEGDGMVEEEEEGGGGGGGEKQSEKHLNNPKFWHLLSSESDHVHLTIPPRRKKGITTTTTTTEKKSGSATTTLHLDIRFVPRFVYEQIHSSGSTFSSPASPSSSASPSPSPAASSSPAASPADSYFGVAIIPTRPTIDPHVGTLWRSSYQQGASFTAVVGRKFSKSALTADTSTCWSSVPAFQFPDFATLAHCSPYNCPIVCVAPGNVLFFFFF